MTEFDSDEQLLLTPHQCSVKGGEHLLLSFPAGGVPSGEVFLVFRGSQESHQVPTARRCPTSLYATLPAHKLPELVSLAVCQLDASGEQQTLHETQFSFTVDSRQFIATLLEQSGRDEQGIPLLGGGFPQLPGTQALREFDEGLVRALQETQLPKRWSLVGRSNSIISSSSSSSQGDKWEDPPPRETLLHFAARRGLNSLAQYLLSLPGAEAAVVLPNEQGLTPLDLSREAGNEGLSQLLQLFVNQVCSNGLSGVDSAMSTPQQSPLHTITTAATAAAAGGRSSLTVALDSRRTSLQELQTFRQINQEWKSQVKRHKSSTSAVSQDFPSSSSSSSSSTHPPHTLTTPHPAATMKTSASASAPLEPTASSPLSRNHQQSLAPQDSKFTAPHPQQHRPTRASTSPPHSTEFSNNVLAPLTRGQRKSLDALADAGLPVVVAKRSDHLLHPLPRFDGTDCSVAAALISRHRKSSWSRVVGNSETRSIGTGLNELDRITAEHLLQQSVHALKMELEQRGAGGGGGGGEELHLALSCHLSASCPTLNQDPDSMSPSLILSAATSPGLCSSFSEDEGGHLTGGGGGATSEDLADSLSPQPPQNLGTTEASTATSYQSDSSMSRTDTCSSFDSQLASLSTSVGGRPSTAAGSSSSAIPQVITTENGGSHGTSLDDDLQSAEEVFTVSDGHQDGIGDTITTAAVGGSDGKTLHRDDLTAESTLRNRLTIEAESVISASISAPNLYALAAGSAGEGSAAVIGPQSSNLSTVRVHPSLNSNSSLTAVEESSLNETATSTETDNESLGKSDAAADATPIERPPSSNAGHAPRRGSHRRSLSTSTVEMLSLVRGEPDHSGSSSVADDGRSSPTSKSVDDITVSGNSILEQGSLNTSSMREGDLDDRSRASSFRTNETLSSRQDSSDDEADFLSAKESTSQVSLDPSPATNDSATSLDNQPPPNPPVDQAEGETTTLLRNKSKRRALRAVPSINRYSADFLSSNADEVYLDNSDNVSSVYLPFRRHQSTNIPLTAEEEEVDSLPIHQQQGSSVAIATSSAESETFLSPNFVKGGKSSAWVSDSVFEHDATLSDVEVKFSSDDNLLQSHEQEILTKASPFFKETGSPKTIKKKVSKSPLFSRKHHNTNSSDNETPSPQRKRRTLTKQDVKPTVKTLRDLTLDRNDNLSDDSDATLGADTPARTASVSDPIKPSSSGTILSRPGSSTSDSVAVQDGEFVVSRLPGDDSPRRPLSPATDQEDKDCTSLDFSPLLQKKQLLYESSPHHPPSPLSVQHTRSPPGSFTSDDASNPLLASASSPHLSPQQPLTDSLSQSTTEESLAGSSNLKRSESSKSSEAAPSFMVGSGRMKHALSLDEGRTGGFHRHGLSPEPAAAASFREHPLAELREEAVEEAEEEVQEQPKSYKRKVASLFRSSSKHLKSKPKGLPSVRGQNDSSSSLDFAPASIAKARPKSASKARPKISNATFEDPEQQEYVFLTAKEYSLEMKRSESMQVNLSHEAGSANRTESLSPTASQQLDNHSISTLESIENLPPSSSSAAAAAAVSLSPPDGPASDSEQDEHKHDEEQLLRSFSTSYPELELFAEEVSWDKTVDRRIYKKMNKAERERQAILHEMLQTERHHLRALHVLKLIFQQNLVKLVAPEPLALMFPELETLIEISNSFIKNMEDQKGTSNIISDFSEILFEQYSGETCEKMFKAFGGFCSGHLYATEIYKEHMKKKSFGRMMKELHLLKDCQRLTLPDYYTQISQRLSKVLTLMRRLVKKSESLKKDHAPRLREALERLECLIAAVDQAVEDHKNQMTLMDIQGRLEVSVPKSAKGCNRKEIKSLSLMAQDRKLRMLGDAMWMGHGRQQSVHVVLLTDLLVLLTERDQKYHLATLQDLKPPVIRLYDLHVRLNASVKSGVQLLLLEQGNFPEMFRLEFSSKKEAKLWESKLNSTIEECKEKGLKCEYFGSVTEVLEAERDSDPEDHLLTQLSASSDVSANNNSSPSSRRLQRARESLEQASKVLSGVPPPVTSSLVEPLIRHTAAPPSRSFLRERESPKNRYRSLTIQQRPKTSTFEDISETHSSTLETAPVQKAIQKGKAKKKLDRSSTFKVGKEKEKEKSATIVGGHPSDSAESFRVNESLYVDCITSLKESLEDVLVDAEEKGDLISKLRNELDSLREVIREKDEQIQHTTQLLSTNRHLSPIMARKVSPRGSPQQRRPHSLHVDLTEREEGFDDDDAAAIQLAMTGGGGVSGGSSRGEPSDAVLVRCSPVLSGQRNHNDKSATFSNHNQLSVVDTGT